MLLDQDIKKKIALKAAFKSLVISVPAVFVLSTFVNVMSGWNNPEIQFTIAIYGTGALIIILVSLNEYQRSLKNKK